MRFTVVKRREPVKHGAVLTSILSLTLGTAILAGLLSSQGVSLLEAAGTILVSFTSPSILVDFIVLSMLGYALLIPFKGSIWNIGAEGQFFISSLPVILLTTCIAPEPASLVHAASTIIASIVLAAAAGALWASIAGFLKAVLGIDEVPATIVLNYIAYYIIDALVSGPLKGRHVYGYLRTDEIPTAYRLYLNLPLSMSAGSPVASILAGFIYQSIYYLPWMLALATTAAATWYLLNKTQIGLRARILGSSPEYLESTGLSVKSTIILTMALSGAIIGFTSAFYVLSYSLRLSYPIEAQSAGYGYLAILVVWLSSLDFKLIPFSAYIMASLRVAGARLQISGLGGLEQSLLLTGLILSIYTLTRFLQEYQVSWR
ncbi:MAG: ABC transporter permease [Desulfurococcus sp.]|nr:ABC transporter permease [Desulfurococcus sp.]